GITLEWMLYKYLQAQIHLKTLKTRPIFNPQMKILAFTDTHTSSAVMAKIAAKAGRCDLAICCGDFTVFGDGMKKVMADFDKIGKKVLLIHGNHESEHVVEKECVKSKNIKFMHRRFYEEDGFVFCGYGGGGFAQRDAEFEKFSKTIKEHM